MKFTVFEKPEIEELAGATAIDCSIAGVTVKSVVPLMPLKVALIVEVPTVRAWENPLLPAVSLMVATVGALEVQVASKVRFWVVESEKVPITANCVVKPLATDGLRGVIVMELIETPLTVSMKEADLPPTVAVRMALPGVLPVTRLGSWPVMNPATAGVSLDQVAWLVMSRLKRPE